MTEMCRFSSGAGLAPAGQYRSVSPILATPATTAAVRVEAELAHPTSKKGQPGGAVAQARSRSFCCAFGILVGHTEHMISLHEWQGLVLLGPDARGLRRTG